MTKLAPPIIEFLMENRNNLDMSAYFTERRLRPLTRIKNREEQMEAFGKILANSEGQLPKEKALSVAFFREKW